MRELDRDAVGARIRQLRKSSGLRQRELAETKHAEATSRWQRQAAARLATLSPWEMKAMRRNELAKRAEVERRREKKVAEFTALREEHEEKVASAKSRDRAAELAAGVEAPFEAEEAAAEPVVAPHVPNSLATKNIGSVRFGNPHTIYRERARGTGTSSN